MRLTCCRDVVEAVTDHLEGALTVEEERAMTGHLSWCSACGTYLQQMRSTVAALRLLRAPDPVQATT